jgi:hypothetical protein
MNAKQNSQSARAGVRQQSRSSRMYGFPGAAVIAIAVLAFSLGSWAQSSDQSLAEVVRENRPARKAAHVITNDEIPSVATPGTASASGSANANTSDGTDTSPNPASSSTAKVSDQKPSGNSKSAITVPGLLNNGSLRQAQALLEGLKHDRQALLDNYDKIEKKLADTNDDSLRQVYSDSLARRNETLARNEKAIADTESAIHAAQSADAQGGKNETQ